jgi:carbamoyltransferase
MYVLGFNFGHNATACLLKDGTMVACLSEERLSGIKNHSGFPFRAVDWMFQREGITARDIDLVVFPGAVGPIAMAGDDERGVKAGVRLFNWLYRHIGNAFLPLPGGAALYRGLYDKVYWPVKKKFQRPYITEFDRYGFQPKWLGPDHHLMHAYSALGTVAPRGSDGWPTDCLVLTCDGEGDLKSATVGVWRNRRYERWAVSSSHNSIGLLYSAVTEYMGMKPLEHEYKIMGLAPYVSEEWTQKGARLYSDFLKVDGLQIKGHVPSRCYLAQLDRTLRHVRFDTIAGGLQRMTETWLLEWVRNACAATGLRTVVAAGGVLMNVKANGEIARLPMVDYLAVCPSAADESVAMGCAYYGYAQLQPDRPFKALDSIYLGLECGRAEADPVLRKAGNKGFQIQDIEGREAEVVADLLTAGKIVGRCVGRCEFGARALGNRSILARPDRPDLVRTLNEQIKNRDFWMPFAGSILQKGAAKYLEGTEKSYGAHMMIAYPTRPAFRSNLMAAVHPYDYTMRPQVVGEGQNPAYEAIMEACAQRMGPPAVLNTSLNLHGKPMAGGAEAAFETFRDSGLQHIVIGPYLLSKEVSAG